jgi:hypothetical protein
VRVQRLGAWPAAEPDPAGHQLWRVVARAGRRGPGPARELLFTAPPARTDGPAWAVRVRAWGPAPGSAGPAWGW